MVSMKTKHLIYRDPLKGDVHVSFCWCNGTDFGDYVWKDVVDTVPEQKKRQLEKSVPFYYAGVIAGTERLY